MTPPFALDQWMSRHRDAIELALKSCLPHPQRNRANLAAPEPLCEAIGYAALDGGKRLRALLCLATAELVDGDPLTAMRIGCAIEMIHAYSLVHDDLPCMDDDALRRGKPTCHVRYGEAVALLVGDALLTQAFEVLATDVGPLEPAQKLELIALIAQSAGAAGMVGGQYLDIVSMGQSIDKAALETLHRGKTGALIRASLIAGAMTGATTAEIVADLEAVASALGLLYQIVDDILDVEATTEQLGKTVGKDKVQEKSTYISLLGVETAKAERDRLFETALSRLKPYGSAAEPLCALVELVAFRQS